MAGRSSNEVVIGSLHDQGTFEVDRLISAEVFDATPNVLVEWIDPETIFTRIYDLDEAASQEEPMLGFDETLEHRFLDPLAVILAGLRNFYEDVVVPRESSLQRRRRSSRARVSVLRSRGPSGRMRPSVGAGERSMTVHSAQ